MTLRRFVTVVLVLVVVILVMAAAEGEGIRMRVAEPDLEGRRQSQYRCLGLRLLVGRVLLAVSMVVEEV